MEKPVEKNRYLTLKGDHVGVPYWKNFALNYTFMGAVAGACLTISLAPEDQRKEYVEKSLLGAAISVAALRYSRMVIYSEAGLALPITHNLSYDQLIDTKPNQRSTSAQKKAAYDYFRHSALIGSFYSVASVSAPYFITRDHPEAYQYVLTTLPLSAPLFIEGATMFHRSIMVAKGKSKIVDKDMAALTSETKPLSDDGPNPT